MKKKHVVRLTDEQRQTLRTVIKKLDGSGQKVRRAQILLKADAHGPAWTDKQIAEAFECCTQTVENTRHRWAKQGFERTLDGQKRKNAPRKLMDAQQEAKVIALRLGPPPKGFSNWSLRLLADKVVALEIVDSVSHETLRQTLKKTV